MHYGLLQFDIWGQRLIIGAMAMLIVYGEGAEGYQIILGFLLLPILLIFQIVCGMIIGQKTGNNVRFGFSALMLLVGCLWPFWGFIIYPLYIVATTLGMDYYIALVPSIAYYIYCEIEWHKYRKGRKQMKAFSAADFEGKDPLPRDWGGRRSKDDVLDM